MTTESDPLSETEHSYRDLALGELAAAGIYADRAEALIRLDGALFQWMRTVRKAEFPMAILAKMGLEIEPVLFHGLTAILRIRNGIERDGPTAPTVGLLAEEMNLDPSRASRIASGLIARGLVVRQAAQEDGRKSVLELTPLGWETVSGFFSMKWQRLARLYGDWSDEDIATFNRLVEKLLAGLAELPRD